MTQICFTSEHNSLRAARQFDQADELAAFRSEFTFPTNAEGEPLLYFAGHSLGLMPKRAREALLEECDTWGKYAVKGHFETGRPWVRCHSYVADSLARIAGAKPAEVVAMNTLTVNLHLMMVSFYRPTKTRYKIIIEKKRLPVGPVRSRLAGPVPRVRPGRRHRRTGAQTGATGHYRRGRTRTDCGSGR